MGAFPTNRGDCRSFLCGQSIDGAERGRSPRFLFLSSRSYGDQSYGIVTGVNMPERNRKMRWRSPAPPMASGTVPGMVQFGLMRTPLYILILFVLALTLSLPTGVANAAKREQSACGKPPQLISRRPLPKEEQEQAKKTRAQGVVQIVISEDGDVTDARVVQASTKEAIKLLGDWARGLKFKARPGCGSFKTMVNFTLAE